MKAQPDRDRTVLWKRERLALAFVSALIGAVIFFSWMDEKGKAGLLKTGADEETRVYIDGAVLNPGLYRFSKGKTVADLLDAAGTLKESKLDRLDRSALLVDGERFHIKEVKLVSVVFHYPDGKRRVKELHKGTRFDDLTSLPEMSSYRLSWNEKRRKVLRDGDEVMLEYAER